MRIRDWSADVCSSDLWTAPRKRRLHDCNRRSIPAHLRFRSLWAGSGPMKATETAAAVRGPDEKGHDLFLAVLPKRFEGGDQDDNDIGIFDGDTDGSGHVSIGSAAKQHKRYQQIYRHQHSDRQMPCTK